MVQLLDGIMGYGNYFAYNGTRALTNAPIVQWLSLATKDAILAQARSIGVPYVYAMSNPSDFTDDELADIVNSLHAEGFMIASAYVSGVNANRLRLLGFDLLASTWEVNGFNNANICTLTASSDWADFSLSGTSATGDGVSLEYGQNISPASVPPSMFLSKAELQVTYTGKVNIVCGKDSSEAVSDGTHPIVLSSYFINSAPTFIIRGTLTSSVVTDIVFKVSKC